MSRVPKGEIVYLLMGTDKRGLTPSIQIRLATLDQLTIQEALETSEKFHSSYTHDFYITEIELS